MPPPSDPRAVASCTPSSSPVPAGQSPRPCSVQLSIPAAPQADLAPTRKLPSLDGATALGLGRRDHQEDAVLCDCPVGGDVALVVLSDGMGGYCCGDVASRIVMTEVYAELKLRERDLVDPETDIPGLLRRAADGANDCIRAYTAGTPSAAGMGATLIAGVLRGRSLFWISVGDSPLYLFRDGILSRLNADHSFGAMMESMVAGGLMEADTAAHHPERGSLLSVLSGKPISQVDCPSEPFALRPGDVVVFSSDGILHLEETDIARTLRAALDAPAAEVAARLLASVDELCDPEQDNVSLAVIRVPRPAGASVAPGASDRGARPISLTVGPVTASGPVCVAVDDRSGGGAR